MLCRILGDSFLSLFVASTFGSGSCPSEAEGFARGMERAAEKAGEGNSKELELWRHGPPPQRKTFDGR